MRQALDKEYNRLWEQARSLRDKGLGISETQAVGELSSYDQHTADLGAETFEREKDVGLLLSTYMQLEQILQARDRLEQGIYGVCEGCHQAIDPDRLRALPLAVLCMSCKEEQEQTDADRRPVEEEALRPPFLRSTKPESAGIDGEDVWEALAQHGTANSPQDVPESLWRYLVDSFPGNPEMEMAEELTPEDMRQLAREYARAERSVVSRGPG